MTRKQANDCRDASVKWYGGDRDGVEEIILFEDAAKPPVPMEMNAYVGTAVAIGKDKPYLAVLCEAAYKAMRNGVSHALLAHVVRPENASSGIGFGSSAGMSGLPVAGANPYAIAAAIGFGTGWSTIKVKGEVMVELTGFRAATPTAAQAPPGPRAASGAQPAEPPTALATSVPQGQPTPESIACGGQFDPRFGRTNFGGCR